MTTTERGPVGRQMSMRDMEVGFALIQVLSMGMSYCMESVLTLVDVEIWL